MRHVIAVILIIGILGIFIPAAGASVISVEPSYLKVSPGDEFTVNIMIDPEGNETMGVQYILLFDNVLLQALKQDQGPFLSQNGASTNVYSNVINDTMGQISYSELRRGVDYGVTSPGTIATITFKGMEQGLCGLNLINVKLIDPSVLVIPGVLTNNGTVELGVSDFDTGKSENPYPSTSGIHKGTITFNRTIVVNKIFTYSCPGTGGHSEYVAFYNAANGEEIANGTWNGYERDLHNITFKAPFELQAGTSYSYTLKTGSYPQIVHAKEYNATGGKITCLEFKDTNGKMYYNWIPAIKLF